MLQAILPIPVAGLILEHLDIDLDSKLLALAPDAEAQWLKSVGAIMATRIYHGVHVTESWLDGGYFSFFGRPAYVSHRIEGQKHTLLEYWYSRTDMTYNKLTIWTDPMRKNTYMRQYDATPAIPAITNIMYADNQKSRRIPDRRIQVDLGSIIRTVEYHTHNSEPYRRLIYYVLKGQQRVMEYRLETATDGHRSVMKLVRDQPLPKSELPC